jgi:hypothetical protein
LIHTNILCCKAGGLSIYIFQPEMIKNKLSSLSFETVKKIGNEQKRHHDSTKYRFRIAAVAGMERKHENLYVRQQ